MNELALVGQQIRYEQKSYWRNPASAFFTFAFPLVFFFILVSLAGGQSDSADLGRGVKLSQYYTPSILGYAVMSACFLAVALNLVRQREDGILKRYHGTPLPAWALIGGTIGSSVIVATALSAVVLVFGVVAFGVHLPAANLAPIIVTIAVAALTFCALGVAVSSLIPNMDAGPAIVNLPFFILVFISGTYFPVAGTLAKVASYFPLRPFIEAMYAGFDPQRFGHSAWDPTQLFHLAIWGVVSAVFAARHFRWMPRTR